MADNKRYYWLKLDENFFEDDTIAWLEEQENGKDYVIFYLKLALKSLKDEGRLIRYVGETLIPYDVKALAKLTNTPIDTVAIAIKTFVEIGLIARLGTGEIYLNQINEMIGTETDVAKRVRKHRAKKGAIGQRETNLLHCNTGVTKCNTEIEIEKEIEKDINKNIVQDARTLFEKLWKLYPNKKGKGQVSLTKKKNLLKIGEEELIRAIDRYKTELEKDKDWRKPQNGSTFFNSGYVDYLDENYTPGKAEKPKSNNKFNQFPQRDYGDMAEMEKKLLNRR